MMFIRRRPVLSAMLLAACVPLLWLASLMVLPPIIAIQAERIAVGRPYCIIVSNPVNKYEYKEANSWNELAYWNLFAWYFQGGSGDFAYYPGTYYALLVIPDASLKRNWSNLFLNFSDNLRVPEAINDRLICRPRIHFVTTIPFR